MGTNQKESKGEGGGRPKGTVRERRERGWKGIRTGKEGDREG